MEHFTNKQGQKKVALVFINENEGASEQSDALETAVHRWADVAEISDGVDKELGDAVDSITQVIDWETDSIMDVVALFTARLIAARDSQ